MNKDFLRRLDLFAGLSENDLETLAAQTESMTVAAGTDLIEEGAPADAAYIVVDGEFEVIKRSDVQDIVIAVREVGEVFGEMALLDDAPRIATVRAVREGRVLKILRRDVRGGPGPQSHRSPQHIEDRYAAPPSK